MKLLIKTKHPSGSSHERTPQLNNWTENETVVSSFVNYEMLLLSYIWLEICPIIVFSEINHGEGMLY